MAPERMERIVMKRILLIATGGTIASRPAEDGLAAAQKKHDLGNLSDNALADAKDKVSEAQDKVDGAAIDLFSAYNNCRWAVDHGILN